MLLPFHDNNPTIRTPYVTVLLIVVNLLVLVWMIQLNPLQQEEVLVTRGFIPKRVKQLTNPNLVVEVKLDKVAFRLPAEQSSVYWSMFSTMFMHGGWMHLIGNMWFLWLFGNNIEDRLGHMLFLFFYIAGGLAATACHWAYDPDSTIPVVGASGAVAAVLGAYAVTYPWAKGINIDALQMWGPARNVTVVGKGKSDLDGYLERALAAQGRVATAEPTPEKGFYYRSDHFSLAKQGVPMLYFERGEDLVDGGTTAGLAAQKDYEDNRYHGPKDEYDPSWNWSGVMQDMDTYFRVGRDLAQSDAWPNWVAGDEFRAIRDRSRANR